MRELAQYLKYSPKLWTIFACFIFSLFFLLFQGGKLAFMLFIIITILCVYLVLGRWSGISGVQGDRSLILGGDKSVISAGASLCVRVQVQVPGFWPIPYVLIKDKLVRRNGETRYFEASLVPDWKRRGETTYRTTPLGRGFYQFSETECATEDIFGLFEHTGRMSIPQSVSVLPETVDIAEWRQFHRMYKGMNHHSATTRAVRETTQINGVREYIYGDKLSRIHWNATAKTGVWKSKEFERESLPKTIVVLDRNEKSYASREQFELAVSVAGSLFQYGMNCEHAFGLLSVGRDSTYFEPRLGGQQKNMVMNHLIEVEANGAYSLQHVLRDRSRHFVPGSFFAFVTGQDNEQSAMVMKLMEQWQMIPSLFWVNPGLAKETGEEWMKKMELTGRIGYAVRSLSELPSLLGGRS